MLDPEIAAKVIETTSVVDDPTFWVAVIVQHVPNLVGFVIFLVVLYKLLEREQTARDASQKDLVSALKGERDAIHKLETAITGLAAEVGGMKRIHDGLQRNHEELRARVDSHASKLDDHDRRIRLYEYSEPNPVQQRPNKRRDTPASG